MTGFDVAPGPPSSVADVDKPVALLSARRAAFAHASLTETLSVMSAKIIPGACLTLGLTSNRMDEHVILANPELSDPLRAGVQAFVQASRRLESQLG